MYGWLIVNEFLKTDRFLKLYDAFLKAAEKLSVGLEIYTNADFSVRVDINEVKSKAFINGYPDFVIFYDKDLVLARALERMGIKVFNSSEAIRICDSKILTMEALSSKVRMPKTFIVPFTYENIGINLSDSCFENRIDKPGSDSCSENEIKKPGSCPENLMCSSKDNYSNVKSGLSFLCDAEKELSYPFIIKESYSSFGMGVHLVNTREEAIEIINEFGRKECSIQEYIETSKGKDVRVFMVGNKCVASMLRFSETDFRSNAQGECDSVAFKASEEMIDMAKIVMKELGLSFAGIDILLGDNNEPILCEANSNAHFLKLLECTGVNATEEIIKFCCENK